MSVIEDAKKATLESTAKMIASQAEKQKVQNTVLGNNTSITCEDITNINDVDYEECDIAFDNNTAKVTITGAGKFEGLFVCNGTKIESTATNESCAPVVNAVSFSTDSWETIVAAVQSGNHPYQVGNTKTVDMGSLGEHTIRVSNTTLCSDEWMADTNKSQTACGFVLEFADLIEKAKMNDTATNAGGWPVSQMRTYVNSTIYNALPNTLKSGIIDTYVVSSHGYNDTTGTLENDNFYSPDKLYLLSPQEVYGTSFTSLKESSNGTSRQLDYYVNNKVSTSNYASAKKQYSGSASYWWLRSALSDSSGDFYDVAYNGGTDRYTATNSGGLAPAFRLAN